MTHDDVKEAKETLRQMPTLTMAEEKKTLQDLAALYRKAMGAGDERLAGVAEQAARFIYDAESAAAAAMYWRDIGAGAGEPIGARETLVAQPGVLFGGMPSENVFAADPSENATMNFVAAKAASTRATYMRDFLAAALSDKK